MKKMNTILKTVATLSFVIASCLLVQTCDSWMNNSDFYSNIENEVKVANATKISVFIRYAATKMGTTVPAMATTEKVDVPFTVTGTTNTDYGFYEWVAFSTDTFDTSKQNTTLIYDSNYETNYGAKKLDESIVKFENKNSESTTVTILVDRNDIVLVPVCAKRATLNTKNTYPKNESSEVVRNQRVTIAFDKEMDFSSFVTYSEDGKTYDWDKDKIRISIQDTNENEVENPYSYFKLPVMSGTNKKQISISTATGNPPPRSSTVNITISFEVKDSFGYILEDDIEYNYKVGASLDENAPTITILTAGPSLASSANWSAYQGYNAVNESTGAADGIVTTDIVPTSAFNSTNIDDWNDSVANTYFAHRVTDRVDILVKILDVIGNQTNTATEDADIDHFVVNCRPLVNPDGSAGTGTIFANTNTNYDRMEYFNGVNGCDDDDYGRSLKDPTDGYAFTYVFPTGIPDGLIKIEIYAEDQTGNSGEETPFAIYVVKDTSAPDLESQISKVKSATASTISDWYNTTTLAQLAFHIEPGTDGSGVINDTYLKKTGDVTNVTSVCSKMQPDSSSFKWAFGVSQNIASSAWKSIDNTGVGSYDMSSFASTITEQGSMSFYAQICDDLGNTSTVQLLGLPLSYDTVAPDKPSVNAPTETNIYPLTAIAAGGTGTFFTKESTHSFSLSALDGSSETSTATTSGIAGFLIPTTDFTTETLAAELVNIVDKHLVNLQKSSLILSCGETANASKKTYYLYTVDNALNASGPTTVTVIQDTTGPSITVTDEASCVYNATKPYFRSSDTEKTIEAASGLTGSVKGFVKGTYYYNNAQTSIPLTLTLGCDSEFSGFDSGVKDFHYVNNSGIKSSAYESGSVISLGTGVYTIIAEDNLGNETTYSPVTVAQDTGVPVVDSVLITGSANGVSSTESTTSRNVTVTAVVHDNDATKNDTGVRSITLSGDIEFGTIAVTANSTALTNGIDYTCTTGTNTATIYLTNVQTATTAYTVSGITLTDDDGTKTVNCDIVDATGNASVQKSDSIFTDTTEPTLTSITAVSTDTDSVSGTNYSVATKNATVSIQLLAHDATTGIKQIYITDSAAVNSNGIPTGNTLLTASSTVLIGSTVKNDVTLAENNAYLTLTSAEIASADETITITNVTVPSLTEGTKMFYAVVIDDSSLRCKNVENDSIIYDATIPDVTEQSFVGTKETLTYGGNTTRVYSGSPTSNTLSLTITEAVSGVQYIDLSSTAVKSTYDSSTDAGLAQFTTSSTLTVGGVAVDPSKYSVSSTSHMTINDPSVLRGTNLSVKIDGITVTQTTAVENRTTVTLTDFAGSSNTASSTVDLYIDTYTARFASSSAVVISDGDNSLLAATDGYTNSRTVNLSLKVAEFSSSSSKVCSGLRAIKLSGATFSDTTSVSYTECSSKYLGSVNYYSAGAAVTLSKYGSAYTAVSDVPYTSGASGTMATGYYALFNNNTTMVFLTPADVTDSNSITFTNVILDATADGSTTVTAYVYDVASGTDYSAAADVRGQTGRAVSTAGSIILDTTAPWWDGASTDSKSGTGPFTATDKYRSLTAYRKDSSTLVYPFQNEESGIGATVGTTKNTDGTTVRYFYTKHAEYEGDYGAVLGIPANDNLMLRGVKNSSTSYYYCTGDVTAATVIRSKTNPATDRNGNATPEAHCTDYSEWQWFPCGVTSSAPDTDTVYSVVITDAAGNYSPAYTFHLIYDAKGPAVTRDDGTTSLNAEIKTGDPYNDDAATNGNYQIYTTQLTNCSAISSGTGIDAYAATTTLYKNILPNHGLTAADQVASKAPYVVIKLPAGSTSAECYSERAPSATASPILYYAVNASATAPTTTGDSSTDKATWNTWLPFTPTTDATTIKVYTNVTADTGPMYLWLKDALGNTRSTQIKVKNLLYDEVWERDGWMPSSAVAKSFTGDSTSTRTLDGTMMQNSTTKTNFYNSNAKIIITNYDDHCFSSSSSTASPTDYAVRFRLIANDSTTALTKAAVDSMDPATGSCTAWFYAGATAVGSDNPVTATTVYPTGASGSYMHYVFEDAVGNITQGTLNNNSLALWTYDNTAPDLSFDAYPTAPSDKRLYSSSSADGLVYYPASSTMTVSASDAVSGMTAYLFNTSSTSSVSDTYISGTAPLNASIDMGAYMGSFTAGSAVYLHVRDLVGNISTLRINRSGSTSDTWTYDADAPTFLGTGYNTVDGTYYINVGNSGVTKAYAKGDSQSMTVPSSPYGDTVGLYGCSTTNSLSSVDANNPWAVTLSSDTTNLYVYDYVGNYASYAVSYYIDTTAPTINVTPHSSDSKGAVFGTVDSASSSLSIAVTDTTDSYYGAIWLTSADDTDGSGFKKMTFSATGTAPYFDYGNLYRFYAGTTTITATDNLGNIKTFTVTVAKDTIAWNEDSSNAITAVPVAANIYSSTAPYYSSGSALSADGGTLTFYSQNSSADITLAAASGLVTSVSDVQGWSTATTYTALATANTVTLTAGTPTTLYIVNKSGKYVSVVLNLVQDETPPVLTGVTYATAATTDTSNKTIYLSPETITLAETNTVYINTTDTTATNTLTTFTIGGTTETGSGVASVLDSDSNDSSTSFTLADSGKSGTGITKTITITDNVGLSTSYVFTLIPDTGAPSTYTAAAPTLAIDGTANNGVYSLTSGSISYTLSNVTDDLSGITSAKIYNAYYTEVISGGTAVYDSTNHTLTVSLATGTTGTYSYNNAIKFIQLTDAVANTSSNIELSATVDVTIMGASGNRFGHTVTGISTIATGAEDAITTASSAVKTGFVSGWDTSKSFVTTVAARMKKTFTGSADNASRGNEVAGSKANDRAASGTVQEAQGSALLAPASTRRDFALESSATGEIPEMEAVDVSKPMAQANVPAADSTGSPEQSGTETSASTASETASTAKPATVLLRAILAALALCVAAFVVLKKKKRD